MLLLWMFSVFFVLMQTINLTSSNYQAILQENLEYHIKTHYSGFQGVERRIRRADSYLTICNVTIKSKYICRESLKNKIGTNKWSVNVVWKRKWFTLDRYFMWALLHVFLYPTDQSWRCSVYPVPVSLLEIKYCEKWVKASTTPNPCWHDYSSTYCGLGIE